MWNFVSVQQEEEAKKHQFSVVQLVYSEGKKKLCIHGINLFKSERNKLLIFVVSVLSLFMFAFWRVDPYKSLKLFKIILPKLTCIFIFCLKITTASCLQKEDRLCLIPYKSHSLDMWCKYWTAIITFLICCDNISNEIINILKCRTLCVYSGGEEKAKNTNLQLSELGYSEGKNCASMG